MSQIKFVGAWAASKLTHCSCYTHIHNRHAPGNAIQEQRWFGANLGFNERETKQIITEADMRHKQQPMFYEFWMRVVDLLQTAKVICDIWIYWTDSHTDTYANTHTRTLNQWFLTKSSNSFGSMFFCSLKCHCTICNENACGTLGRIDFSWWK